MLFGSIAFKFGAITPSITYKGSPPFGDPTPRTLIDNCPPGDPDDVLT